SRRRNTRSKRNWSSDVCSSDFDILQISVQTKTPNTNRTQIGGLINNQGFTASDWRGAGRVGETRTSRSSVQGFMVDNNGDIELRSEERRVGIEWRIR